jgi:drug/metabolite transporter (DMT)-like permease
MYYASMLIAITGLTTYQLVMKKAPHTVNPFWMFLGVYLIAAIVCVPMAMVWSRFISPSDAGFTRSTLTPAALLAAAVLMIEVGYLLVYRSGWSLSVAPGFAQAMTLSLLFLVAIVFLNARLTLSKVAGLLLALGGVFLLTRKG